MWCSLVDMSMPKKSFFPMFELGPPCEVEGCSGVLVNTISLETADHFKKCGTCGEEFYRMTAQESLDWSERVFRRAFEGGQDD